ncbi:Uma2 family endonuclease [Amycolatopsis jejuensis]|uniref:Uma2 family endonuclease n=1 Tax=Amycolatopsis jejuensis TaxID=330084 RepID=UPI0005258A17|nr:Uma2 family endonuclease [Amycolatopsis jejuensis]
MTALPEPTRGEFPWEIPDHLLSIEEYAALGETDSGFTELVEGRLMMSPSPRPDHGLAMLEFAYQLRPHLPEGFKAVAETDVDLALAPEGSPGFSRRPDLLVTSKAELARRREQGGLLRATEILLVVEIVSPGSKRTDYVTKHDEYADAGIPFYWILDLSDPVSLVACHQAGELGYQDAPAVTGTFRTTEPFPAEIDLTVLLD